MTQRAYLRKRKTRAVAGVNSYGIAMRALGEELTVGAVGIVSVENEAEDDVLLGFGRDLAFFERTGRRRAIVPHGVLMDAVGAAGGHRDQDEKCGDRAFHDSALMSWNGRNRVRRISFAGAIILLARFRRMSGLG